MDDSFFRQKGAGVPRGVESTAEDAVPSERSGGVREVPIWEKFVRNTEAVARNRSAVAAEDDMIRAAGADKREVWGGDNGRLIRKVGGRLEEHDPEQFVDDPVVGPYARKSLWDREKRRVGAEYDEYSLRLEDPAFKARELPSALRKEREMELEVLPDGDARKEAARKALADDDATKAERAELERRRYDAKVRATRLNNSTPDEWWQNRGAPVAESPVVGAVAARSEADAADDSALEEEKALDGELMAGVKPGRLAEIQARKAEIAQARSLAGEKRVEAGKAIEDVKDVARNEVEKSVAERGFWSDTIAAFKRGYAGAAQSANILQGATDAENAQDIADYEKLKQANPASAEFQEFQNAKGFVEAAKAFIKNPVSIISEVLAESAAQMVPSIALGAVGGSAGGALASAPTGGAAAVGTVPIGAAIGSAVGAGTGSYLAEYGSAMMQSMQEAGMDATKPESIQAFFGDEEKLAVAREFAVKRGIPVAIFDAVSMGLAGKFMKPVEVAWQAAAKGGAKVTAGQVLKASGKELAAQAGFGMGGEAGGQLLSEGQISDGKGVFLEGIAEVGFAPLEVASNLREFGKPLAVDETEAALPRVNTALTAIDPELPPATPEEIKRATMISTPTPEGLAEAVLIERELATVSAEDDAAFASATEAVAAAKASGDKDAVKAAEEAVAGVQGRAETVRAVLKIAGGQDPGALSKAELGALGLKREDGKIDRMSDDELAKVGLDDTLVYPNEYDGTLILTDEALKRVEAVSPRARGRVKMTEAEALAKANERANTPTWEVGTRDGGVVNVRAATAELAEREVAGSGVTIRPGSAKQVSLPSTSDSANASGEAAAAAGAAGTNSTTQPNVGTRQPQQETGASSNQAGAQGDSAGVEGGNGGNQGGQARKQTTVEDDIKTVSETVSSVLARTGGGDAYAKANEERAAAAKRILASLRPGDIVYDPDFGPRVVERVSKDGKTVWIEGEGTPLSHIVFMATQGRNANGEVIDIPPAIIKRANPGSSSANSGSPPKNSGTSAPGTAALKAARARINKLSKQSPDLAAALQTGPAEATATRVSIDPEAIISESVSRGMTDAQALARFNAVLDEEIKHMAQRRAAKDKWESLGSPGTLGEWYQSYYGQRWADEFSGEKATVARALYSKGDPATEARWEAMPDADKFMEATRMMMQRRDGTVTEATKLWANISKALIEDLRAMLRALRAMVKGLDMAPSLKADIEFFENELRNILKNQPRGGTPKAGSQVAAPGKKGAGTGGAPPQGGDSGPDINGRPESPPSDGAGASLAIGARVTFPGGEGVVRVFNDKRVSIKLDDGTSVMVDRDKVSVVALNEADKTKTGNSGTDSQQEATVPDYFPVQYNEFGAATNEPPGDTHEILSASSDFLDNSNFYWVRKGIGQNEFLDRLDADRFADHAARRKAAKVPSNEAIKAISDEYLAATGEKSFKASDPVADAFYKMTSISLDNISSEMGENFFDAYRRRMKAYSDPRTVAVLEWALARLEGREVEFPAQPAAPTGQSEGEVVADLEKFVNAYSGYHLARVAREEKENKNNHSAEYWQQQRDAWAPDRLRERVADFLKAIDGKNVAELVRYNNGMFDGFWKLFALRTRIKVPSSQRDKATMIRDYVGAEAYDAHQAELDAARAKREEEQAAKDEEFRISRLESDAERAMVSHEGRTMNGREFAEMMLADGWRVTNVSTGAVPDYRFTKGGRSINNRKGFGAITAYAREKQKALEQADDAREEAEFNALPQEDQDAIESLFTPGGTKPLSPAAPAASDEIAIGDYVQVSDGKPKPPAKNAKQLREWESRNFTGWVQKMDGPWVGIDRDGTGVMVRNMHRRDFTFAKVSQPQNASNPPLDVLRDNVTGAIERGEKEAIVEIPALTEGDKAVLDALDGLFASPLPEDFAKKIPRDRFSKLMDAVGKWVDEGLSTPEALAEKLRTLADGRIMPFSQSIWGVMRGFDGVEGAAEPSWSDIYSGLDKTSTEADGSTEEQSNDTTQQPGNSGSPDSDGSKEPAGESSGQSDLSGVRGGAGSEAGDGANPAGQPNGGRRGGGKRGSSPRSGGNVEGSTDRPGETGADSGSSVPAGGETSGDGVRKLTRPPEDAPEANFVITDDFSLPSGPKARIEANLKAIRLLREIEKGERNATPEEKAILAKYSGWGSFKNAFNQTNQTRWEKINQRLEAAGYSQRFSIENSNEYAELKAWRERWGELYDQLNELLEPDEFRAMSKSILNAHYTSLPIIDSMWKMVERLGFKGGKVLETSVGGGYFVGRQPKRLANQTDWSAVELDEITSRIFSKLYPEARINGESPKENRKVNGQGFQQSTIPNNSIDLVIGNFPFDDLGPNEAVKEFGMKMNLHNYFFARSLDKVRPGGLVVSITSASTMDNNLMQRELLAGRAELVAAIRLPNTAFKDSAGTEVTTDIIILRKKDGSRDVGGEAWLHTVPVGTDVVTVKPSGKDSYDYLSSVPAGWVPVVESLREPWAEWRTSRPRTGDKWKNIIQALKDAGFNAQEGIRFTAPIEVNQYFENHPEMVMGKHALAGTMYSAGEYAVVPDGGNLMENIEEAIAKIPENVLGENVEAELEKYTTIEAERGDREGSTIMRDGKVYQVIKRQLVPVRWDVDVLEGIIDGHAIMKGNKALRAKFNAASSEMSAEDLDKFLRGIMAEKLTADEIAKIEKKIESEVAKRNAVFASWSKVRDTARELVNAELNDLSDEKTEAIREKLNEVYDAHVAKFGAFNKRGQNPHRFLDDDEDTPLLDSLEDEELVATDEKGKPVYRYVKRPIFSKAQLSKTTAPESAESIEDAVGISIGYLGRLSVPYMAKLLGTSEGEVSSMLNESGLALVNPKTGLYETADMYLSGEVRTKLREAEKANLESGGQYVRNIELLKSVIPPNRPIQSISVNMGARWMPGQVYTKFAQEVLGLSQMAISYQPAANIWRIEDEGTSRRIKSTTQSVTSEESFETDRVGVGEILDSILNKRQIAVYDNIGRGQRAFNSEATVEAKAKADQMAEKFNEWVKTSDSVVEVEGEDIRVGELAERLYNENVAGVIPPNFKGDWVTLPGQSGEIWLKPHRKAVLARMLTLGYGMMAHGVGSGKTYNQIALAMELRRLGKARKVMTLVQNSTIKQFAASHMKAYPQSRILVADEKNFTARKRAKFQARIATGDYDSIILTHSNVALIGHDEQAIRNYMARAFDQLTAALADAEDGSTEQRDIQKAMDKLQEKLDKTLKEATSRAGGLLTWEQLGIDALIVDEAHAFKNAPIVTRMARVKNLPNGDGSAQAIMMQMKVANVQATTGGKNIFFATGTPITNTMAEAYTMLNFIAPNLLEQRGIKNFDDFATTFGRTVSEPEATWKGEIENVERFAKFINGPELVNLIRSVFDVALGNESMGIRVPKIKGGKPTPVLIEPTEASEIFNDWIIDTAAAFAAIPNKKKAFEADPWLSAIPIMTMQAGMAQAIDPRLINPNVPDDPQSKVNRVVDEVARIYKQGEKNRTAQVIFSDLSNPFSTLLLRQFNGDPFEEYGSVSNEMESLEGAIMAFQGKKELSDAEDKEKKRLVKRYSDLVAQQFNLFEDIKEKLVAKGIPANEIAIASSDMDRKKLQASFEKVNSGQIRVIMGSTARLGVGVNIQERLAGCHNLSPPRDFKPAMMEQRIGRIERQGNLHRDWADTAFIQTVEKYAKVTFEGKNLEERYNSAVKWLDENDNKRDLMIRDLAEKAAGEFDVEVINYGLKLSMDSAVYSMMNAKQGFIEQVLMGENVLDEFDDPASEEAAGFALMAAEAMGNEDLKTKVVIDSEIRKLRAIRTGYLRDQWTRKSTLESTQRRIQQYLKKDPDAIRKAGNEIEGVFHRVKRTIKTTKGAIAKAENREISEEEAKQPAERTEDAPVYRFGDEEIDMAKSDSKIIEPLNKFIVALHAEAVDEGRTVEKDIFVNDVRFVVSSTHAKDIDRATVRVTAPYKFPGGDSIYGYVSTYTGNPGNSLLKELRDITTPGFAERYASNIENQISQDKRTVTALEKAIANQKPFPQEQEFIDKSAQLLAVEGRLRAADTNPRNHRYYRALKRIAGEKNADAILGLSGDREIPKMPQETWNKLFIRLRIERRSSKTAKTPEAITKFLRDAVMGDVAEASNNPVSDDTEAFGRFIDEQEGRSPLQSSPLPRADSAEWKAMSREERMGVMKGLRASDLPAKASDINTNNTAGANIGDAALPSNVVTPEMDADYLAAVESGNLPKASRILNEAARKAGAIFDDRWESDIAKTWFHGSSSTEIEGGKIDLDRAGQSGHSSEKLFFLSDRPSEAAHYAVSNWPDFQEFYDEVSFGKYAEDGILGIEDPFTGLNGGRIFPFFIIPKSAARLDGKATGKGYGGSGKVYWDINSQAEELTQQGHDVVLLENMDVTSGGFVSNHAVVADRDSLVSASIIERDFTGNIIPLSQRFNQPPPADSGGLKASPLPPAEPQQRARDSFNKNRAKFEEAQAQVREFGNNTAGANPIFANPGSNPNNRDQFDIARMIDSAQREVRKDRDTFSRGREYLDKYPEEVERLLMEHAYGDNKEPLTDYQQHAINLFLDRKAQEAGGDKAKLEELYVLATANIINGREMARAFRMRMDRFATPEERAQSAIYDAIFTPNKKIAARAEVMAPKARKEFLAEEGKKRIEAVEKELRKLGVRLEQVIGKNRDLALKNSALEKDMLKLRNALEQDIIRFVQKGASMADIRRRFGKLGAEQAADIITKARQDLFNRIKEMAAKGMNRQAILDAMKDTLKASPLNSPAGGMTDAEIWAMIDKDFGIPDAAAIPKNPLPRIKKPKVETPVEVHPLSANWARPEFANGMASYTFDAKDRAGIMERVEIIRGLAGAVGKINELTGPKRDKALKMLDEINAILAKYGTDAQGIFEASQGIEDYGFDISDIAQVAAVSRAINALDADIIDKATEYLYFSMLSGMQTMVVNATAILPAAWESTVGRGVNMAINRFVKDPMAEQFGEGKYIIRALAPGLKRAMSNFAASMAAQHPMFDRDVNAMEIDWDKILGGGSHRMIGSISGRKGDLIRLPMRLLTATDDFNRTLIAMAEVGTFAYRMAKMKGMKDGSPEMDKFIAAEVNTPGSASFQLASQKASRAIYSNPLPGQKDPHTGKSVPVNDMGDFVGFLAGKLTSVVTAEHDNIFIKAVGAAMRIAFFPFQRTPFNIIRKGIRHTLNPFSMVDIALGVMRNAKNEQGKWEWTIKGTDEAAFQRHLHRAELIERAGQQLQGAILMAALYALAWGEGDDDDQDKRLIITGSMPFLPTGRAERDAKMRSGLGPFRVSFRNADGSERVGFSYGRIEPVATILAATIDTIKSAKRALRSDKDGYDATMAAMGGLVSQAQDKSFMRGIGDFIALSSSVMTEPDLRENRKALQFLAGRAAMVMPNIIKQPIRESDNQFRERSEGFMQELMYQAVPVGQKAAKVDPYGQPVTKPGIAPLRPVDVADIGKDTVNPYDRTLMRWSDKHPDKAWFPSPIMNGTLKGKDGKDVDMTAAQLAEFRDIAGKRVMAKLKRESINHANPTELDIKKMREAHSEARSEAKKMLAIKYSR